VDVIVPKLNPESAKDVSRLKEAITREKNKT